MIRRVVSLIIQIFYKGIHLPVRILGILVVGGILLGAVFMKKIIEVKV